MAAYQLISPDLAIPDKSGQAGLTILQPFITPDLAIRGNNKVHPIGNRVKDKGMNDVNPRPPSRWA